MSWIKRSFSALDEFTNKCERYVYYKRIAKLPEPPSHYLAIGNFYHAAIAGALRGVIDLDAILETCKADKGWETDVPDSVLLDEVRANLARLRKEVFPHISPTHIEAWSNKINQKAKYCAKLDVVSSTSPLVNEDAEIVGTTPHPCVVDWKTVFSAKKKRDQETAHNSAQLALYCLEAGVKNAFFVEVPRAPAQPIRVIGTSFDDYSLARWDRYLQEQFRALETRGLDMAAYKLASPGFPLCCSRWCSFWRNCPGGEKC